jgi:uncharacterized protein with HEPN domain
MKRPDLRAFLFDVQESCQLVEEFRAGMTLAGYMADPKTRSAVERQLEIMGEAIGQMLRAFPEMAQEIPEAPQIIAFRNHLIHGYASVSDEIVWGVLEENVPELAAKVRDILARTPPP